MGKRRANGEGSYYKMADGRWCGEVKFQRPDGSPVRIRREAKTRTEVVAKITKARAAIMAGADGAGRMPTISEHLERWFRDTFVPRARPNSQRTYRSVIDFQIVPFLGDVRIDRLTAPRLRSWLAELGRTDDKHKAYAPATIALARSILREALDQAVEDRQLAANPITRRLTGPKVPATAGKAMTTEQAQALLAAVQGHRLGLAIRLALGLGLRRGEVTGLRHEDIDFDAGTLTVRGQMVDDRKNGLTWVAPKTKSAVRTIALPAVLLTALRWHQAAQERERLVMGWEPSPYLFTGARSGGPLNPGMVWQAFKEACEVAGLEGFRLHDLRHSAASFLLAEKVSMKKVQSILGHARASTTLAVYGHLLPGDSDDATERLQRRLDGHGNSGKSEDDPELDSGILAG